MPKTNLLINLPPGFFASPATREALRRAKALCSVRKRSWNAPDEIRKDLQWADAVLMWSWPVFTDEMLDKAPRLKFSGNIDVSRHSAEIFLRRGLAVSTSRRAWAPAVAEMALGLTLSTLRKISACHLAMRAGKEKWVQRFPDDVDPDERELTGRPVGIVGFGAVGRRYAELLAPFHCPISVYDPFLPPDAAARAGVQPVSLNALLKRSDVVTLCAASNAGTRHLLGKREITTLRQRAVLVNVARAALVDTSALIARLKQNDLYAAIDVFDREPLDPHAELRRLPNAFLTPHRAGGVLSSVTRTVAMLVDDLEAHLNGRPRAYALTASMLPGLDA
ncbi:MAG TPA: NAD(P)-dependent oxidoreductase [Planctomycetota bacterium]